MDFLPKLQALKDEKGLTYTEIAELSGVPEQTVKRIFTGNTPNPSVETMAPIVSALGGSLDDVFGPNSISLPKDKTAPAYDPTPYWQALIREKDIRINEIRRDKRILFYVTMALVTFIVLLLSVDLLNGNFGYFRY